MWVINLLDYYEMRYRPNRWQLMIWRGVLICGLVGRASAYKLRSLSDGDSSTLWRTKSEMFFLFSKQAMQHR
jgi:hypothetical protein